MYLGAGFGIAVVIVHCGQCSKIYHNQKNTACKKNAPFYPFCHKQQNGHCQVPLCKQYHQHSYHKYSQQIHCHKNKSSDQITQSQQSCHLHFPSCHPLTAFQPGNRIIGLISNAFKSCKNDWQSFYGAKQQNGSQRPKKPACSRNFLNYKVHRAGMRKTAGSRQKIGKSIMKNKH